MGCLISKCVEWAVLGSAEETNATRDAALLSTSATASDGQRFATTDMDLSEVQSVSNFEVIANFCSGNFAIL